MHYLGLRGHRENVFTRRMLYFIVVDDYNIQKDTKTGQNILSSLASQRGDVRNKLHVYLQTEASLTEGRGVCTSRPRCQFISSMLPLFSSLKPASLWFMKGFGWRWTHPTHAHVPPLYNDSDTDILLKNGNLLL